MNAPSALAAEIDTPIAPTPGSPSGAAAAIKRWSPAVAVLAFVIIVLLARETPPADIARYGLYALWAVVLPGTLLYRALRAVPHSLVDDLAMGSAVGLVLEIAAFAVFSALDLRWLLWLWPALVVVPFLAVPSLRRHWRPRWPEAASAWWSWSVAGVAMFLVGYLAFSYLRVNQPVPVDGPQAYFNDSMFGLALVAEAKQHFPMQTSWVSGEPLLYHWFAFANMAMGSMISGVDAPMVMFRLALPSLCVLAVVLLAVAGWRASGKAAVGAVATALTFAIGEFATSSMAGSPLGGVTAFQVWVSQSLIYGGIMTFPLIALIADRFGKGPTRMGKGAWVLLALFALAAPGGKATVIPVALAGVGLVCLVQLLRRRFDPAPWVTAAILVGGQLLAMAVLYQFTGQGLAIEPLSFLDYYLAGSARSGWKQAAVTAFVLGGFAIYMFVRLIGIAFLVRYQRRSWGAVEWFLTGGLIGGVMATILMWHSGLSQNFFTRTAFPFGAILSAMGIVLLFEKHRISVRHTAAMVGAAIAAALGLTYVLRHHELASKVGRFPEIVSIYERFADVALIAAGAVALLWLGRRLLPATRIAGLASAFVVTMFVVSGITSLPVDARTYPDGGGWFHQTVTPESAQGARWLRAASGSDDVIATNVHCSQPPPADCLPLSFWLSAFTERRMLVEGWGYTTKANAIAAEHHIYGGVNFAVDLLARNDAAIYTPTSENVAWLRAKGVRWIVVDHRFGQESADLGTFADLRWNKGDLRIYELQERG
ncbi:hypothetical protein Rhe02_85550 [Rhizocola hellebori]|uniref:Uncharacterized protein n=1 Tax=Rhizocola hellebori TaxID=1392758 RepID=A0A8J3QGM5_9ACTN|nr:hypothetical protein [Rhizocola hellebori]GIH10488.1 hypothetical protein Rhe02_85550 [Rhizocola hellebori]